MNGGFDDTLAFLLIELTERLTPGIVAVLVEKSGNGGQRLLTIGYDGNVGLDVLVNLAAVNVQVDNLGLLACRR